MISLSVWHEPADEPLCEVPFDFGFEQEDTTNGMRRLIIEEVQSFRQLVRQQSIPDQGHTAYVFPLFIFPLHIPFLPLVLPLCG
jgi:mitogen-activated protein kinase 7